MDSPISPKVSGEINAFNAFAIPIPQLLAADKAVSQGIFSNTPTIPAANEFPKFEKSNPFSGPANESKKCKTVPIAPATVFPNE